MKKVEILRKKYPNFVYQGYDYKIFRNDLRIFFDFRMPPNIKFRPEIIIKNTEKEISRDLDNFVFHLGLMEIPTYWKAACSPIIEIKASYLNKEQIKWWQNFILNGMGQFFYENQIDFRKPNFLKIKCLKNKITKNKSNLTIVRLLKKRFLVPMGEGKDSIVTLELLKKKYKKENINCFIVNPKNNHFKILKVAGINEPIIIERKVDRKLLDLNKKGFLNGHTPITALISNLAVFCAVLFGYNDVAMSCEKSADEGNIKYLRKDINHQWSKNSQFEREYQKYIKKYLTKDVKYFSFLRSFYEFQIAKIFSQFPQYFPVFLSCNEARKTKSGTRKPTGKWCGKCSKCLFIWTILYPFVKERDLIKIFKKNLFEDEKLIPVMKELIGESRCKPFECVGTQKESLAAFYLALRSFKRRRVKESLPSLLQYFERNILPKYPNIDKFSQKFYS